MTVKNLNYSGTRFCLLKPEIARFSIGIRLKAMLKVSRNNDSDKKIYDEMEILCFRLIFFLTIL